MNNIDVVATDENIKDFVKKYLKELVKPKKKRQFSSN